jgi:adenylosuccinate synthase
MPSIVVVGTQWGDEGKGKIVDILSERAHVIARFQGGSNAGHTVVIGESKVILHQIPTGILRPGKKCLIGNGVVLDPEGLLAEIDELKSKGYFPDEGALLISEGAHVVMPYHKRVDQARERRRGKGKIGTTGRGIGPAYEDKVARTGIRMADLVDEEILREKLKANLEEKNSYLTEQLGEEGFDLEETFSALRSKGESLKRYVVNVSAILEEELKGNKNVLFEGAQGCMLDVDQGTYPYVTSSNTGAGAACVGTGVGPTRIDSVLGVAKAYTTRVGSGPFPTELANEIGERLRKGGGEFGATTGRPRRCGCFDAVVVRNAVRLSGIDEIALTKLDVLCGLSKIQVCVAYRYEGSELTEVPATSKVWEGLEPVYEELDGWDEPIHGAREPGQLPSNAKRYIERIEELIGKKISMISVSEKREDTITLHSPFK